ncbi:MAG: hypothetical protein JKY95_10710 [Planctomycetaceae bacterium]|nr:hypothetical protein [Planctomycetaceae bacterium]
MYSRFFLLIPVAVLQTFVSTSLMAQTPVINKTKTGLWILSGQSNACGRAKLPGPMPDARVTMYDPAQKKFVIAQDPLPFMGTSGAGAWVAAAQQVVSEHETQIRMCGFASGGKPISFWHPGEPGHRGLFPVIEQAGQQADVFLWYQGENDAGGNLTTAEYLQELTVHVACVRKVSGNPKMLAVIIQLGPSLSKSRGGYMALREAQRLFVIQDSHAILVPALGRTLKDSVHLDNAGYQELGREIGRAVLRTQYNNRTGNWPGPILDAAMLQPRTKARVQNIMVAHFAEVEKLQNVEISDFAVIDAEGTNRCNAITAGNTIVTLSFERDVVLPARLVYGFGTAPQAALTDESGNRAPAVQISVQQGKAPAEQATQLDNGAGLPLK